MTRALAAMGVLCCLVGAARAQAVDVVASAAATLPDAAPPTVLVPVPDAAPSVAPTTDVVTATADAVTATADAGPAAAPAAAATPPQPATTAETAPADVPGFVESLRRMFSDNTMAQVGRAVLGLLIFIIGWLLAKLVSSLTYRLLCRVTSDGKLAAALGVETTATAGELPDERRAERMVSRALYYVLLIGVCVAMVQYAGLTQSSGAVQGFARDVRNAVPLIGRGLLILVISWVVGRILQKGITRALQGLRLDERIAALAKPKEPPTPPAPGAGVAAPHPHVHIDKTIPGILPRPLPEAPPAEQGA